MYLPKVFEETRKEVLIDLIQKNALGCLIINTGDDFEINHLPFEYDASSDVLLAHIAKVNPLSSLLERPQKCMVVFTIDHAYVSPNWYVGKFEHHRAVPTWNYVVIHAKGTVEIVKDEKVLRGILARLIRQHESNQPKPWKMSDAPKDYIQEQLNHIYAIRISISELIGKFKLSQNRDESDYRNVSESFKQLGHGKLYELMEENINKKTS